MYKINNTLLSYSKYLIALIFICSFVSCQTYNIDKTTFINTFEHIDSSAFSEIEIIGIYGERYECLVNQVKSIEGSGEDGVVELKSSPEAEIIVNKKSGGKKILYFDSIFLKDSVLYGKTSRVTDKVEAINLNNIEDLKWIYHHRGVDFKNKDNEPIVEAKVN